MKQRPYPGATKAQGRWFAYVVYDRRVLNLAHFATRDAALAAGHKFLDCLAVTAEGIEIRDHILH